MVNFQVIQFFRLFFSKYSSGKTFPEYVYNLSCNNFPKQNFPIGNICSKCQISLKTIFYINNFPNKSFFQIYNFSNALSQIYNFPKVATTFQITNFQSGTFPNKLFSKNYQNYQNSSIRISKMRVKNEYI